MQKIKDQINFNKHDFNIKNNYQKNFEKKRRNQTNKPKKNLMTVNEHINEAVR